MNVQETAERWLSAVVPLEPQTPEMLRLMDHTPPRHQCNVPDGSVAGKMQQLALEMFLLSVQARMNADVSVQHKREDLYDIFGMISLVLEDDKFDRHVTSSHVVNRRLHVPPPPP